MRLSSIQKAFQAQADHCRSVNASRPILRFFRVRLPVRYALALFYSVNTGPKVVPSADELCKITLCAL